MKQFLFLLPLLLIISSSKAINIDWSQKYDGETFDNFIEDESTDEFLVGGPQNPSVSVADLQVASDSAERVANGVFDLYRLLASDNKRLNQIVSNLKQTVGKDTYDINHVFKHIKNGNYYLEVDTDKYNFAVTIVRLPRNEHSNHNAPSSSSKPVQTTTPVQHPNETPRPTTTADVKTTPESTTARPTTPVGTTAGIKTTPESTTARPTTTAENPRPTTPESTTARPTTATPESTTARPTTTAENPRPTAAPPVETPKATTPVVSPKPTPVETPKATTPVETPKATTPVVSPKPTPVETPKATTPVETPRPTTPQQKPPAAIHPEDEYLRRLEDKRFRQILGQWYLVGVANYQYSEEFNYRACEIITIYTHGTNYFFKEMNNIGNSTYEMKDIPMTSVDKKNSLFKMDNSVYAYKMVLLEGKEYKVKLFQLTNINKPNSVYFYTERLIDRSLLSRIFKEHYASLNMYAVDQYCYSD